VDFTTESHKYNLLTNRIYPESDVEPLC
jgi:hypothetical protein